VIEPLTEAQQCLAAEAVGRADRIAERYAKIFPKHEQEFKSSALWGVMRAASSFDPDKGDIWERWSALAMEGEILDLIDAPYYKRFQSLNFTELIPDMRQMSADLDQDESNANVRKILCGLPPKHRELCDLVYTQGLSAAEAGLSLGLSEKHGRKIHSEAMVFLREDMVA